MKHKIDTSRLLFSNHDLLLLLVPLMIEQLLNSLMGTFDTIMVSNVGSAAISAVSLVDSINILVVQVFAALAAGGTIVCSQYIGKGDPDGTNRSAHQVFLAMGVASILLTVLCVAFRFPLLQLIFGDVEADVMSASQTYFLITALSYPFLAFFDAHAAFFRAEGNSRLPMTVSVICNFVNIGGNALLIFGFHMGVAGAALATLFSRILMGVVMICFQRRPRQTIVIRNYAIKPEWALISVILSVGVPAGVENGMFQFGKLAIQSTVSTMGTTAIAAQAMTNILEYVNGVSCMGIGIGLMTIVGQCIGAGEKEQAAYYIKKLCVIAEIVMIAGCVMIYFLAKPITMLGGMEAESASMCLHMMFWITIVKPIVWVPAFVPVYGLRSAGDVKFPMTVSTLTMWICRVSLCIYLVHAHGFGPMAVWIGMFTDWTVRAIIFTTRYHRRKWLHHKLV